MSVLMSVFHMRVHLGIYMATCDVTWEGKIYSHAIVWDTWRRLLFTGGGDCTRRCYNGIKLVEADEDIAAPGGLLHHLQKVVQLGNVHAIYTLYVRCKEVHRTHAI